MKTPWARGNMPSPNERRKLPSQSNTIIGCSPRLKTKTLSCRSTPTPPISLNDQPGGSFAQFSTGSKVYAPLPTVAMTDPLFVAGQKLVTKQNVGPASFDIDSLFDWVTGRQIRPPPRLSMASAFAARMPKRANVLQHNNRPSAAQANREQRGSAHRPRNVRFTPKSGHRSPHSI